MQKEATNFANKEDFQTHIQRFEETILDSIKVKLIVTDQITKADLASVAALDDLKSELAKLASDKAGIE